MNYILQSHFTDLPARNLVFCITFWGPEYG